MKPLIHWLRFDQKTSGLYTYTYSLHKAALELGYDSHICYSDYDLRTGGRLRLPNPVIGEVDFSPWSVADEKGAINFTHDQLPHKKFDNWITEMHGHPIYIAQSMEALTAALHKLERAKLIFTRFPSHVQYWQQVTKAPVCAIPPGVDLNYWKPEGKRTPFMRPVVLWADTVREPIKTPYSLLYAMKMVIEELPTVGIKLVGIPPNELAGYAYLCGRLGLDSAVEFPLMPMVPNTDELYRGANVMYSDTNEEGSNASWEAEAVGLPVVHHKETPNEIAQALIEQLNNGKRKVVARDIKETVKAMYVHLEAQFS